MASRRADSVRPDGNTRDRPASRRPAISTPASSRPRTSSSRRTRRTSSRTSASRRTAASASGTATSSPRGSRRRRVHGTKDGFAQGLKIPQANVRVITQYMGGGFGSKFGPDAQGLICAQLAQQAQAAGQADARSQGRASRHGQPSVGVRRRSAPASRADGKLTAFDAQSWGTGGAGATSNFPLPYIYNFPNRRRTHTDVYINAGQQRAMRAPGHPQGCFLTEILMDELADRVRMDPVAFRIKNLPPTRPNATWGDYFREGAKAFGWDKRHRDGRSDAGPDQDRLRRVGASAGAAAAAARSAHCDITSDGSVVMKCGTQDLGTGTRTHRRDGDRRNARPAGQRGARRKSATRSIRSAAARAAARRRRRSRRRSASRPARRSTRCSRRSRRQLGVDAPTTSSPKAAAST